MQLIRGIANLPNAEQSNVVSIGNYDGVHLGHQQVIKTLLQKSQELAAPSTVITFDPLAREFFMPNSVVRLTSVEQRAEILYGLGVDQVVCIDFTAKFAASSPLEFVQNVLIQALKIKYLCVGDDFRFGKDRVGDFRFLQDMGAQNSFCVTAHETYELDGERVSSGRVRDALSNNDFSLAQRLLGRPYSISGYISKGQQIGRTLNYPTANLVLEDCVLAISGVFAVTCKLFSTKTKQDTVRHGVANLGKRPTVDGLENRLEVHLFDFNQDIYGKKMEVVFVQKIRDEQKFDSIELLREQIGQDAEQARQYFQNKD